VETDRAWPFFVFITALVLMFLGAHPNDAFLVALVLLGVGWLVLTVVEEVRAWIRIRRRRRTAQRAARERSEDPSSGYADHEA
jgi:hypothetical protein